MDKYIAIGRVSKTHGVDGAVKLKIKERYFDDFAEAEAKRFFGAPPRGMKLKLTPKPTGEVQEAFVKRFRSLLDPA